MESVLEYRKNIEEVEKQEFAKIQREYLVEKNRLEELDQKLHNAISSQLEKSGRKVIDLKNLQQYILYLQEKFEIQKQLVLQTEKKLEAKRQQLLSVQRDRKMMERHREKALEKYRMELEQEEQKNLDELALYAYMRK